MKIIILLLCFFVSVAMVFAQQQTFDISTFTPPKGWKQQVGKDAIQLSKDDAAKGTYCLITLYKAVPATANAKDNFDMAWASLIKEMVTVSAAPVMQPSATENGWEAQSGYAQFESDGNKGIAILITSSGFNKMVNAIVITNTDVYEKEMTAFLESISFKKSATDAQPAPGNNKENAAIVGTWGKKAGVNPSYADPVANGNAGYSKDQYTFNTNGTYSFASKTFRYSSNKLLLVRENGSYQISGNNLTINPQKSVIEAWSKRDGTDKWGNLLSTQNRPLEKITYTFTKHYFSGIEVWNLVLQASQVTGRDGPFSNNTTFSNAWYYAPISSINPVIEMPVR